MLLFNRSLTPLTSLLIALALSACGGGSNPFAAVPDESPAPTYSDTWDLTFTVTASSGCEDLDIFVGDSNSEQIDFSEWGCDLNDTTSSDSLATSLKKAKMPAFVSATGTSEDDSSGTYDIQCQAGGQVLVAQFTASDSENGCSYNLTATNTLTLAEDGETLEGTQVVDFITSGCASDGFTDFSCHSTSTISGERVDSTPASTAGTTPLVDADYDGYTADEDCNDNSATINPGATETCDGVDNDCDDSTDENVQTTYYADADGDTYGDATATTSSCSAPTGYVSDATDCDDTNSTRYPGAIETADDGIDQDCDGIDLINGFGETSNDSDGDGYDATTDCDDNNATVYPGASEVADGLDNDCDGRLDEGLVSITLDSLPSSIKAGEAFSAQVTVTNNSGLSDFIVEARIHDTVINGEKSIVPAKSLVPALNFNLSRQPKALENFCSEMYPCTTLASDALHVEVGQSTTYTFTGLVTENVDGKYYFVVRILVDGQELVYSRAYQSVEVTSAE